MLSIPSRLAVGLPLSLVVLVGAVDAARTDDATVPPTPIAIDFSQRPDAAQDALVRELLADEVRQAEDTERGRGAQGVVPEIRIGEADVNQDQQTDLFVQIWSMAWCAPAGCQTWLLLNDGHTYRQVLGPDHAGLRTDIVYVTADLVDGFRTLAFGDGSATGEFCVGVTWTGAAYAPTGAPPDPSACPPAP